MGWCRAGLEHPGQGHTAGHAPQRPSGAPEGPPGPRLLPKAVLLRWLQEGTRRLLLTPRPWPLAEGGRVQGTVAQAGGCVRGAIWILGSTWVPRGGAAAPAQLFLALGVSYFLLLEYHSRSGTPMDGRVMTPKAAQSSCGNKEASLRSLGWARGKGLMRKHTPHPSWEPTSDHPGETPLKTHVPHRL